MSLPYELEVPLGLPVSNDDELSSVHEEIFLAVWLVSRQELILSTAFSSCIDRGFNSRQNFFTCPQRSSLLSSAGKQPFGSAMAKSVTSSSSSLQVIGQPVIRIDARVKVTGEAQFSADRMPADGLLYGKTLRSPHPHAEIVRIDTAKADGLPGVRAVVTFRDAPENPFEDGDDSVTEEPLAPVYCAQSDRPSCRRRSGCCRCRLRRDRRRGVAPH